jgi:hypothetical protein
VGAEEILEDQASVVAVVPVLEFQSLGELGRGDGSGLIEELEDGVSESVFHHPIEGLIEPGAGIAERVC